MEYKILITGTMGAGKTTAIGQLSTTPPVSTDVMNTARDQDPKETTTAAFDYGEVDLGEGDVLRIYGTPGQLRFDFMWTVLARGALGIVYLIDCSRSEPIADLEPFIEALGARHARTPAVVALNKVSENSAVSAATFQEYLELRNLTWPVYTIDARDRDQMLDVLEMLLSMAEVNALEESNGNE